MDSAPLKLAERAFGIEFIAFDRQGDCLVVGSGSGLAVATMDIITRAEYLMDVDNYRMRDIDWECVAAMIDWCGFAAVFMVGWFTVDRPDAFDRFCRGIKKTPLLRYDGGGAVTLGAFYQAANRLLQV